MYEIDSFERKTVTKILREKGEKNIVIFAHPPKSVFHITIINLFIVESLIVGQ